MAYNLQITNQKTGDVKTIAGADEATAMKQYQSDYSGLKDDSGNAFWQVSGNVNTNPIAPASGSQFKGEVGKTYVNPVSGTERTVTQEEYNNPAGAVFSKQYQEKGMLSTTDKKEEISRLEDKMSGAKSQGISDKQPYQQPTPKEAPRYGEEMSATEKELIDLNNQSLQQIDSAMSAIEANKNERDQLFNAQIEDIKRTFEQRKAEMEIINKNSLAGQKLLGARAGRTRYAGEIQRSIISNEERAGISRLGELDNQMNSAILQAQQAKSDGDFKTLMLSLEQAEKAYNQKRQLVLDLNTLAQQKNVELRAQAQEARDQAKFIQEQAANIASYTASSLISEDEDGNLVMPDDDIIAQYAEQYGTDPMMLKTSLKSQMAEMSKMDRESYKEELNIMKLQGELAMMGMSEDQQEYEYAVQNYGYQGTIFDYIQDQKIAQTSPYELIKQQLEIQNLQNKGQDFTTFTADGKTYVKYDDGTIIPFKDLFPSSPEEFSEGIADSYKQWQNVQEMIESDGLKRAVGPKEAFRGGVFDSSIAQMVWRGLVGDPKKQKFLGEVSQLTKQLTLDKLVEAKSKGATFGALSDTELKMLSDAASAISNWEVKDEKTGKIIGYEIDENTFKEKLSEIQKYMTKAIKKSSGAKYVGFDELAENVNEDELERVLNTVPGNTLEEKKLNALQYYNQIESPGFNNDRKQSLNYTPDSLSNVKEIKDFSKVETLFGKGTATGIVSGSKFWDKGFDFVLEGGKGAPVKFPLGGTVVQAKNDGAWGNSVKVKTPDGKVVRISHLDGMKVKPGQKITPGMFIGTQGNTGKTYGKTGVHLDITVYDENGKPYTSQEAAAMFNTRLI